MLLFGSAASPTSHVLAAFALSGDNITVVVKRATGVTVAGLTTVPFVRQVPIFRQALVAIAPYHVSLARAFARVSVAALVVNRALYVARARLAPVGIVHVEIPKAVFAPVAPSAVNVGFAVATAGFKTV